MKRTGKLCEILAGHTGNGRPGNGISTFMYFGLEEEKASERLHQKMPAGKMARIFIRKVVNKIKKNVKKASALFPKRLTKIRNSRKLSR